ncbi:DUF5919 domain-containing protein [Nonomuraea salmonea]|uniref:DUF5919 domain-containing protein n=1 Tax=Nonomuraea salmonea TaxID=46181 RepID=UPI002FEA72D2
MCWPSFAWAGRARPGGAWWSGRAWTAYDRARRQLKRLLDSGTRIRCLFLDPKGQAIRAREAEEGYTDSTLTTLTALNISMLTRLRDRLDTTSAQRLELHPYGETIRFNLLIVDRALCVVQPYLPQARSRFTYLCNHRQHRRRGLFPIFRPGAKGICGSGANPYDHRRPDPSPYR